MTNTNDVINKVLLDAAELLSDPSRWTKGVYARTHRGTIVEPKSRWAVCWCMAGAIRKCAPNDEAARGARNQLNLLLDKDKCVGILNFNDCIAESNEDVVKKLKAAVL